MELRMGMRVRMELGAEKKGSPLFHLVHSMNQNGSFNGNGDDGDDESNIISACTTIASMIIGSIISPLDQSNLRFDYQTVAR